MSTSSAKSPSAISESLHSPAEQFIDGQLDRTRSYVRIVDLCASLLVLGTVLLSALLLLAIVDAWVMTLGWWARLSALLLLVGGSAFYLVRVVWPLMVRQINPLYAARVIEESHPSLKNSLINFLFVRRETGAAKKRITAAVEARAATDLKQVPVESVVDRSRLIIFGYALVAIVTLGGLYTILSPKDPFQTFLRIAAPLADVPPPASVKISDVSPGDATVFFGEPLEVSAAVRGVDEHDPVRLYFSTLDGKRTEVEVLLTDEDQDGIYEGTLTTGGTGIQQSLRYWITAGDARTSAYRVEVRSRPTMVIDELKFDYPDYTGYEDRIQPGGGDVSAIEGTRIVVTASANLPISRASIELMTPIESDAKQEAKMPSVNSAEDRRVGSSIKMQIVDGKAKGEFRLQLRADRQTPVFSHFRLRFWSEGGETNRDAAEYAINVIPDLTPEVQIVEPTTDEVEVPLDRSIVFRVSALDPDFQIQRLRLVGNHQGDSLFEKQLLEEASNSGARVEASHRIKVRDMGLAVGDEFVVTALAEDNRQSPLNGLPDPNQASSRNVIVRVVAPEGGADPLDGNAGEATGDNSNADASGNPEAGSNAEANRDPSSSGDDPSGNGEGESTAGSSNGDANRQPGDNENQQSQSDQSGNGDQSSDGSSGSGSSGGDSNASGQSSDNHKGGTGGDGADGQQSDSSDQNSSSGQQDAGQSSDGANADGRQGESSPSGKGDGSSSSAAEDGKSTGNGEGEPAADANDPSVASETGQNGQADGQSGRESTPADPSQLDSNSDVSQGNVDQPTDLHDGEAFERLQELIRQQQAQQQEGEANNQAGQGQQENDSSGNESSDNQQANSQQQDGGSSGGQQSADQAGGGQQQENQSSGGDQSDAQQGGSQQQDGGSSGGQQSADQSGGGQQQGDQSSGGDPSGANDSNQSGQRNGAGDSSGATGDSGAAGSQDANAPQGGQSGENGNQSGDKSGQSGDGQQSTGQSGSQESTPRQSGQGRPGEGQAGANGADGQTDGQSAADSSQGNDASPSQQSGGAGSRNGQGESGDQVGNGADDPNGESSSDNSSGSNQPSQRGGGTGSRPSSGSSSGGDGNNSLDASGDAEMSPEEKANLEYTRQAIDLVLDKLDDQQNKPDPRLLEEMNWSEEDLRDFIKRWKQMKQRAESGTVEERKLWDEKLRSLGLRPGSDRRARSEFAADRVQNLQQEGTRTRPPSGFEEAFRAFQRGTSRAANSNQ